MTLHEETVKFAASFPFVLDQDPVQSARAHADWHVPIAIAAVINVASSAFWSNHQCVHKLVGEMPYYQALKIFYEWPKWAAASYFNLNWLLVQGLELCHEHKYRFKSSLGQEYEILQEAVSRRGTLNFPTEGRTPWPVSVEDSRKVYLTLPAPFPTSLRWNLSRPAPEWYVRETAAVLLS